MVEEDVDIVKKFKVRDRVHPRLVARVCKIFAKTFSKKSF